MPNRFLGVLWHESPKLSLGPLMFEIGRSGLGKGCRELRPGIGRAHVDNANGIHLWLWRIDPKQLRHLAALNAAPELPLRRHDQVLVERISMGQNLDPLPASRDDRQHRGAR